MRRVIISPAQLKMINESELRVTANSAGGSDLLDAATNANVGQSNQGIKVVVPGNTGKEYSTTFPELQKGSDIPQDASSVYIEPTGNTNNSLGESRFSKRQVELGRLLEMRKNGKVFSKRQLNEMFMETQENAERLRREIGKCRLYDIFDAIEEVFPEELENAKNVVGSGADLPEFLCSLFSKEGVDSDREEEFLDMLGI